MLLNGFAFWRLCIYRNCNQIKNFFFACNDVLKLLELYLGKILTILVIKFLSFLSYTNTHDWWCPPTSCAGDGEIALQYVSSIYKWYNCFDWNINRLNKFILIIIILIIFWAHLRILSMQGKCKKYSLNRSTRKLR